MKTHDFSFQLSLVQISHWNRTEAIRDEYQCHGLQSREVGVLCTPSVGLVYKPLYKPSKSSDRTVNGGHTKNMVYRSWVQEKRVGSWLELFTVNCSDLAGSLCSCSTWVKGLVWFLTFPRGQRNHCCEQWPKKQVPPVKYFTTECSCAGCCI